jgi:hypothetical protein
VLKSRNVNGKVLWTYTYDKLNQIVPNFAEQLSMAINNLAIMELIFAKWKKEAIKILDWFQRVVKFSEKTVELSSDLKLNPELGLICSFLFRFFEDPTFIF